MIRDFLENKLTAEAKSLLDFESENTQHMLKAMEKGLITGTNTISLPYFSAINPKLVRDMSYILTTNKLATVRANGNFAEMQFNTALLNQAELQEWRRESKLSKFTMRLDTKEYPTDLVKRNGKVMPGGLDRPAMMDSAKRTFEIDTVMLAKYKRPIKQNLVKSIKKMIEKKQISDVFFKDEASYLEVAELCIQEYLTPGVVYNSEYNVQDQRGRAIKAVLKRVGNYISSKDFRALLKVPRTAGAIAIGKHNTEALADVYYFIAELTGHKCIGGTEAEKIKAGKLAYEARELPRLDLKTAKGRDELHELIWLERIYNRLDKLNKLGVVVWDIPLEIDHSMLK